MEQSANKIQDKSSKADPNQIQEKIEKSNERFPLSIRITIYSFLTLTDMMKTICRLSRTEREHLLTSELLTQKKILKINTRCDDYIDFGNLEYFSKLSDELRYCYSKFNDKESMLLQYSYIHFKEKLENSDQNFIISQNSIFNGDLMKSYVAKSITQLSL